MLAFMSTSGLKLRIIYSERQPEMLESCWEGEYGLLRNKKLFVSASESLMNEAELHL
jgi:hypothetical protein